MQESTMNHLLNNKLDASLTQIWQLLKHQAQKEKQKLKVRFSSENLPAHYPSEVTDIQYDKEQGWLIKTSLPSLSGCQAAIPRSMYQQALNAYFEQGDLAALDFFDSFNNRYYRLYCQTEQKHNLVCLMENEHFSWNNPEQSITSMLAKLCGFFGQSTTIKNNHLIQYTGVIGMKLTSIAPLRHILQDYFDAKFEIEQSPTYYQTLTPCSITQLGLSGTNQQLGINALLGKSTVSIAQKLDIKICPRDYQHYVNISNDHSLVEAIKYIVLVYMGVNVKFNLFMKVNSRYLPRVKITTKGNINSKIGKSAWMSTQNQHSPQSTERFVHLPMVKI